MVGTDVLSKRGTLAEMEGRKGRQERVMVPW